MTAIKTILISILVVIDIIGTYRLFVPEEKQIKRFPKIRR